MFDLQILPIFMVTVLILKITPGPNIVYVVSNGLSYGKKAGIYSAIGIETGGLILIFISALGVASLIRLYPTFLQIIQYTGAGYLLWLAYQIYRSPIKEVSSFESAISKRKLLTQGVVTNILNPKALLFTMAFLPQFANPNIGNITLQIILLGILSTFVGTIINLLFGIFSGSLGKTLLKNAKYLNFQKYFLCMLFVVLAITLLL